MTTYFDPARSHDAYEKQLKPELLAHKPLLWLDDRNEFYVELLAERSLLEPLVSAIGIISGWWLRLFPSLCSDFHVVGRKP